MSARRRASGSSPSLYLALNSTTEADKAQIRPGDLIILVQQLIGGGAGVNPTLLDGFTNWTFVGDGTGGTSVALRVSHKRADNADRTRTYTHFRKFLILRNRANMHLDGTSTIRDTTGTYDASALAAPIGFAYTVTRAESSGDFPPGTIGTVSTLDHDYNVVEVLSNSGNHAQIRIGLWLGNAPATTYTLTLGTSSGSTVFRRFHALHRA